MTDGALEKAVVAYRPMLIRLAYSCTGNFSDSEDIAQEAFVKLYLRRGSFPSEEDMKAWLIRVTVNMCKNHVRSWSIGKRSEIPADIADGDDFPEKTAVRELLQKLKPIYRAVIYMHYYEGYTAAEIGKLLKISETAVTTRLQRGRESLKKFLED
ncbi:MAG: RNA polymerase sigma factor [Muribaculaceae bacterium]|nr:RNA polymerase sigma factor [Muribaculaceae bacterium]MCM1480294.1 RNA polymerase sigma factor [Muribaculaceae bacterium]